MVELLLPHYVVTLLKIGGNRNQIYSGQTAVWSTAVLITDHLLGKVNGLGKITVFAEKMLKWF